MNVIKDVVMTINILCAKHRNNLIKALENLNAAFIKRSQEKNDEFAEEIVLRWKPIVLECICTLKKNKSVFCKCIFENKEMGKKFMKLFCRCLSNNKCNDLIVLLNGFKCVDYFCMLGEIWRKSEIKYDDIENILRCIDECVKSFFSAFNDVNGAIKTMLILPIGYMFELESSRGKCRVFSRKKCECFIKPYQNIMIVFLHSWDVFVKIAKDKEYAQGWNDCEVNCRQSIETACTDAVGDVFG